MGISGIPPATNIYHDKEINYDTYSSIIQTISSKNYSANPFYMSAGGISRREFTNLHR